MYQYMQFLTKKWRQQGAIIAFTALLLPMIIVGVGLAVDLGNIYVQYSRLQNAADAAALAGATAYADANETVEQYPNAKAKSEQYIQGEFHNLKDKQKEQIENNYKTDRYKVLIEDNVTYYQVKLYKEVPLYFLGGIYKTISGKETYTVPVKSVAAIPQGAGIDLNYMFIFEKKFVAVNIVDNHDVYNPDALNDTSINLGPILSTFDGRIIYTNKNLPKENMQYSTQRPEYFDRLFTEAAKEYKNDRHTVKQLMDKCEKNPPVYDGGRLVSGYWCRAEPEEYNYRKFIESIDEITKDSTCMIDDQNINSIRTSDANIFKNDTIRVTKKVRNLDIIIDSSLPEKKDPIFIFVEAYEWGDRTFRIIYPNENSTKMRDIDNVRPLIICVDGDDKKVSKVHFNMENGRHNTFRGIVFTPYTDAEGMVVNAGGCDFRGTIAASSIYLAGKNASYRYVNYLGGVRKGNTSAARGKVRLVS